MRHGGSIPEEAGAVGADADRGEGHDGEGGALHGRIGICCLLEHLELHMQWI